MKFILILLLLSSLFGKSFGQNIEPVKIIADGVELYYFRNGGAAAFSGQLRKAGELYNRDIEIEQRDNKEYANKQSAAGDAALFLQD